MLAIEDINSTNVYLLGRKTTLESYGRIFHYKCSQNILYLNKQLFRMKIKLSSLCSFCRSADETIPHLFYECQKTKILWANLKLFFNNIPLPDLTLRSAYLGFDLLEDLLINHIHLLFRIAIYSQRNFGLCSLNYIISKISHTKLIELNLSLHNLSRQNVNRKWARLPQLQ